MAVALVQPGPARWTSSPADGRFRLSRCSRVDPWASAPAIFNGDIRNISIPNRDVDRWFNIDAGFNRKSAVAFARTSPRTSFASRRKLRLQTAFPNGGLPKND